MLANLPAVTIDPVGGNKFILALVTATNGETKLTVWAAAWCEYHRDILSWASAIAYGGGRAARTKCLGGGRISVDPEKKTVRIWDYSRDFGREPDRGITVRLLKEAFPEYTVTSD